MASSSIIKQPQLCKVCAAPAGKHIYYGARTCISCRGFFRRSVQSRQYKWFSCVAPVALDAQQASCPVDSKSRKSCKKCRFDKCTEVGMKIGWVLSEEERCQRMIQRSTCKAAASVVRRPLVAHFSKDEKEHTELLYDVTMEIFKRLYYQMYASDLAIMRSSFDHSFKGRPFSFQEVKFFEAMDQYAVTEVFFRMFRIHNMHNLKDAHILARHNVSRLVGLYQSLICKQGDIDAFMTDFLSYGMANRHLSTSVELVLREMEDMKLNDKYLIYNYDILYSSPWARHIEYEEKHRKITENINDWLRNEEDLNFDKVQLVLITLTMVFCTDGLIIGELNDLKLIEETQMKYLSMLHRYLKDKYHDKAHAKLVSGMFIIHDAKEAHEINHNNRLPI